MENPKNTVLFDRKLVEKINGNIYFQLFCVIFTRPSQEIRDTKLISKIRREIKARTEETEILWILFGVHVANGVRLTRGEQEKKSRFSPQFSFLFI